MTLNKPVILLRPPHFSDAVPVAIRQVIEKMGDKIVVANLDTLPMGELASFIEAKSKENPQYNLSDEDKAIVSSRIHTLLGNQRKEK